ncbi:MAG: hypothetical protein HY696_12335 [Deltaproteobacteria bacterium]|nr:hypothetical protein [Deltaproteobacteria bacterium]
MGAVRVARSQQGPPQTPREDYRTTKPFASPSGEDLQKVKSSVPSPGFAAKEQKVSSSAPPTSLHDAAKQFFGRFREKRDDQMIRGLPAPPATVLPQEMTAGKTLYVKIKEQSAITTPCHISTIANIPVIDPAGYKTYHITGCPIDYAVVDEVGEEDTCYARLCADGSCNWLLASSGSELCGVLSASYRENVPLTAKLAVADPIYYVVGPEDERWTICYATNLAIGKSGFNMIDFFVGFSTYVLNH